MSFREFYQNCTFTLCAIGDSNWDLYIMEYQGQKGFVALAKPDTGASDCHYGNMNYLSQLERKGINHGFTIIKKHLTPARATRPPTPSNNDEPGRHEIL